ncbi:thioredoxin [Sinimarinibacterium sp. NLF-5-8]|uniref:thioredoxin n=1 Tax=Sinimarinibacterium sp. NLF-5-8 TaxID=2698684 RepID=UPI00137BE98B|nr:thioredoxin [Sinimarinibacterium sp. NLF-5-8]QHS10856.1 thioredoxin [Sinimarinibacterium sp. NLF-5-8]
MIRACPHCGKNNRIPSAHLADHGRCGACQGALLPAAAPLDVDSATFADIIQSARVPVLVDFWAAWCGPCKMAAPEVKKAAANLAGKALVLKVDTEANPQLSAQYNIRSIPNFAVFSGGQLQHQQAGLVGHAQLEQLALRFA